MTNNLIHKNPVLEISLENKYYIEGSLINGLLILNNFNDIIVKYLKIILIGTINNNFNINDIFILDETLNIFRIKYYYDFINNIFIDKNVNNKLLLNPCQKNINIDLQIPKNKLASTYNCKHFNINYKLIIILDYIIIKDGNKENKNNIIYKEKEINIIPLIFTFDNKYLIPIIMKSKNKINTKKFCGNINYSIFIPYQCYIPGDKIPLEFKINNISNINNCVIKIKICLQKQLVIINFFDYIAENKTIFIDYKNLIYNKNNNNTIIKFNDIQLPYNVKYSILSNTTQNIFELRYVLRVNVTILINKKCIPLKETKIPIIVGSYRTDYKNIEQIPFLPIY